MRRLLARKLRSPSLYNIAEFVCGPLVPLVVSQVEQYGVTPAFGDIETLFLDRSPSFGEAIYPPQLFRAVVQQWNLNVLQPCQKAQCPPIRQLSRVLEETFTRGEASLGLDLLKRLKELKFEPPSEWDTKWSRLTSKDMMEAVSVELYKRASEAQADWAMERLSRYRPKEGAKN